MANSNPYCQTHKVEMLYKKGVSKAGKDYEGYFCPEKNEDGTNCQSKQWINKQPYKKPYAPKSANYSPKNTQESASQIVALRKVYALILAVAHIQGMKQEDIDAELKRMDFEGK